MGGGLLGCASSGGIRHRSLRLFSSARGFFSVLQAVVISLASYSEIMAMRYTILPQMMTIAYLKVVGCIMLQTKNKIWGWFWLLCTVRISSLSKLDVLNNAVFYMIAMSSIGENNTCQAGQDYLTTGWFLS